MRLILKWVLMAVAIGVVAAITPGVDVYGGFGTLLWISLIFGLVDTFVGPVLRLISLPFIVLTFGLFLLIVNAALLAITAALSSHLNVDGFWSAVLGGFLMAVLGWVVDQVLLTPEQRRRAQSRRVSRRAEDNEWQI